MLVEYVRGLFSPVLVTVQETSSYKMNLLGAATLSITAVVEEMSALVPDQTESCGGDPLVWTVADPLLLSLKESLHHPSDRQDVRHLPSIGSGSQFDVPLLC